MSLGVPGPAGAPVETLLLDAGGVFLFPNWERVSQALSRRGVDIAAEALAAVEPRARRQLDVPATVAATNDASRFKLYFDLVFAGAGLAPSAACDAAFVELAAYHARVNLWEHVPPAARAALEHLRQAGLRLVVVSNANGTVQAHLARLGLASFFDAIIDSHDVGVEKPDPRIFHLALERAGARPETALHAGDLYHVDVVGARAAGLAAVLVDEADLYADHPCVRVPSLAALARRLTASVS